MPAVQRLAESRRWRTAAPSRRAGRS